MLNVEKQRDRISAVVSGVNVHDIPNRQVHDKFLSVSSNQNLHGQIALNNTASAPRPNNRGIGAKSSLPRSALLSARASSVRGGNLVANLSLERDYLNESSDKGSISAGGTSTSTPSNNASEEDFLLGFSSRKATKSQNTFGYEVDFPAEEDCQTPENASSGCPANEQRFCDVKDRGAAAGSILLSTMSSKKSACEQQSIHAPPSAKNIQGRHSAVQIGRVHPANIRLGREVKQSSKSNDRVSGAKPKGNKRTVKGRNLARVTPR